MGGVHVARADYDDLFSDLRQAACLGAEADAGGRSGRLARVGGDCFQTLLLRADAIR
ncbi:MAG: hypothetical protein ABSD67_12930 [Terracidiphilus sp.]|jgi:hypothetical protein